MTAINRLIPDSRFPLIALMIVSLLGAAGDLSAAPMGGMGKMRGGGELKQRSPEEQAREIAMKLSLSENQQVEVVYLLENMFRHQADYLKQARDADELSRPGIMEHMTEVREKTIEQVGVFLNDSQLAKLLELLSPDMNRLEEGRRPASFGGAGQAFRDF